MVPLPLYNISSIYKFSLVFNQLKGKLPPDMGFTLPNLKEFYIGVNKFSEPLPPSIANASKLVYFDIAENSFNGPLPMNLGILRSLEDLNLATNQFGTNQPNSLSYLIKSLVNCTNLLFLQLSQNGFRGELPNSVGNLSTMLTTLVINRNYISGNIPQETGNLVNLMKLSFGDNMLTGSITKSIGKLSKLGQLYLISQTLLWRTSSSNKWVFVNQFDRQGKIWFCL